MSGDPLETPIPRWDHDAIAAVLAAEYGLAGDLTPLPGERDQNVRLDGPDGSFAVKIVNPAEDPAVVDMQQAALEHIARFPPGPAVPEARRTLGGSRVAAAEHDGTRYAVRVQTFLPGEPLRDAPVAPRLVGEAIGSLQRALRGFFHPAAGRHLLWDARRIGELRPMVGSIEEAGTRRLVTSVIDRVERQVLPQLAGLPAQVIHNDVNDDNVLVAGGAIAGVVDFGDLLHGPRIMDVAVAASYLVPGQQDAAAIAGELCLGVQTAVELSGEELEVLLDMVATRLCQTIAIGAWRAARHPDNAAYILVDADAARDALAALTGRDGMVPALFAHAGVPRSRPIAARAEVAAARRRFLAPGLRLSYDEPLHVVSGDGVWVKDAAGRRYLDAYNNVVQVGHGHPLIARTLAAQTRRLNTNTRYLTDEVVAYAERLTALLPDGLDVCFFTNSGSEANDLAWRIARTVTGHHGAIVTHHAYHGTTTATMAMSPEELRPDRREPWVTTVPPPPGDAGAVISQLDTAPAALFLDTIFSSDGIFDPPACYLDAAAAAVRAAGGLYVADEVQAGLGRVGRRMWGFAAGSAVPDIVTLGKPIGNGHPIGAVVTTEDIARRFAADGYFFSTFGGNTVSAAVGLAVLAVTRAEDLPGRAERVGRYLRDGIRAIGGFREVRGAGMFTGVETADAATAGAIVESMRDRGVLVGRTGPGDSVVKIRPPLVFAECHADTLLEALSRAR